MGGKHGHDHRVILAALGLVDGGGVGQLQPPRPSRGVVRVPPVKADSERPRLYAGHDLLGHATASFTLNVYAHTSEQMMKDTVARMQSRYDGLAAKGQK